MHNNRFAGTALIVLGAIFLLPQISGVGFPLWQWWPLFPMAAGLVSLSGGNWRGGLILIAIFSVFLPHNLGACPSIRSWRRKTPHNNLLTALWTL